MADMQDKQLIALLEGEIAARLKAESGSSKANDKLLADLWLANSDIPQTASSSPCKLLALNAEYLRAVAKQK